MRMGNHWGFLNDGEMGLFYGVTTSETDVENNTNIYIKCL